VSILSYLRPQINARAITSLKCAKNQKLSGNSLGQDGQSLPANNKPASRLDLKLRTSEPALGMFEATATVESACPEGSG
jgi:hypothetical protein